MKKKKPTRKAKPTPKKKPATTKPKKKSGLPPGLAAFMAKKAASKATEPKAPKSKTRPTPVPIKHKPTTTSSSRHQERTIY